MIYLRFFSSVRTADAVPLYTMFYLSSRVQFCKVNAHLFINVPSDTLPLFANVQVFSFLALIVSGHPLPT